MGRIRPKKQKIRWMDRKTAESFGYDYDRNPGYVYGEEGGPYIKYFEPIPYKPGTIF